MGWGPLYTPAGLAMVVQKHWLVRALVLPAALQYGATAALINWGLTCGWMAGAVSFRARVGLGDSNLAWLEVLGQWLLEQVSPFIVAGDCDIGAAQLCPRGWPHSVGGEVLALERRLALRAAESHLRMLCGVVLLCILGCLAPGPAGAFVAAQPGVGVLETAFATVASGCRPFVPALRGQVQLAPGSFREAWGKCFARTEDELVRLWDLAGSDFAIRLQGFV